MPSKTPLIPISIIIILLFIPILGTAQTITLTPTDDTYVDHGQPTTNFGSNIYIQLTDSYPHFGAEDSRYALVKFSLSDIPADAKIKSATLHMYAVVTDSPPSTDSSYVIYHILDDTWSEDTVTYSTSPSPASFEPPPWWSSKVVQLGCNQRCAKRLYKPRHEVFMEDSNRGSWGAKIYLI